MGYTEMFSLSTVLEMEEVMIRNELSSSSK